MRALTYKQALVALQGGYLSEFNISGKYDGVAANGDKFQITEKTFERLSLKMVIERFNMGGHTCTTRKYVLA